MSCDPTGVDHIGPRQDHHGQQDLGAETRALCGHSEARYRSLRRRRVTTTHSI
ncbi:hypothetical protein EYF80_062184 [Liparis tanakae]|uniref:Uncharacterized protein n=1 Tax=Liparis tanakae TaxID=230148 RepID=A0A4Z2EGK8_9TELE|nr:hypothetical protein EYF80_062184 [Liparis tanakae]